jgi:hypothetical protein
VVKDGEVDNTTEPVPVDVVVPVPPDATGKVPVVNTEVEVAYTAPPEVNDVNPVPPLLVAIVVADQVPEVTVPTVTTEEEPAAGAYAVEAVKAAVPKVPPVAIFKVEVSLLADKVTELFTFKVFPLAIVSVAEVVGAVIVTLLIEVAVATPKEGVVKEGEVANTNNPVPVSSLITPANSAEVVAANCDNFPPVIAIVPDESVAVPPFGPVIVVAEVPALRSVTVPVLVVAVPTVKEAAERFNVLEETEVIVNPLIVVAVAAPKLGVVKEGEVEYTTLPVPVVAAQVIVPALFCRLVNPVVLAKAVKALAEAVINTAPVATVEGIVTVVHVGAVVVPAPTNIVPAAPPAEGAYSVVEEV